MFTRKSDNYLEKIHSLDTTLSINDSDLTSPVLGIMKISPDFNLQTNNTTLCPHLIINGQGYFKKGKKTYPVEKGDIFTFFPGEKIAYGNQKNQNFEYIWLPLEGDKAYTFIEQLGVNSKFPLLKNIISKNLKTFFTAVIKKLNKNNLSPLYKTLIPHFLLDDLMGSSKLSYTSRKSRLAWDCRELIESQYMNFATIYDISNYLNADRTTLYRHFFKSFDISPKQFLDKIKIENAKSLLHNTNMTIKEISYACGFNDPNYFNLVFHQKTGSPPGKWRYKNEITPQ